MCCVNRGFQTLFERIRYSDVPVLQASLSPAEAELSTQLFYTLVMLLQGRALDIAQNTDLGNGLEVYRKLVSEYRPRLASRFVGTLTQLMSHKFTASLEAEIPFFEKLVRRYEAETGKVLDDTIKLGIIINGLQDDSLKQHVVRNSARLKTYQLLKDELLEVARTSRVLAEQPVPMDLSALPKWKQKAPKGAKDAAGKGKGSKGKDKGQGSGSGKPSGPQRSQGSQGGGQGQGKGKDVICWYCEKKGHTKAECRKKQADDKQKAGKGNGGKPRRPHAASPAEEEPEPMLASPTLAEERGYVAAVTLPQEAQGFRDVLVDTGAGSHLFTKGFDSSAQAVGGPTGAGMVTVTGEPLSTGEKKRSRLKTLDGQGFSVEYAESDKVNFSVLSSGLAASKGTWTVIGPDVQCLILDKNAHKVRRALGYTKTIELQKKRGVYWLPVQNDEGKGPEPTVLAATKAAKKVVPAEAMSLEEGAGGTAQGQAADGTALEQPPKEDSESPARASSNRGPETQEAADRPALGEPPEEDSEAQRKTRSKRIPDLVSEQEYKDHMMTHLPFRSWCDHCVAGKSRVDSHPLREARKCKGEVPRFCVDYCFLGRALKGEMPKTAEALKEPLDAEDGQRPILVMVDQETGATFSYLVTKGVNNYAVHVMSEALKFAGRQRVLIMSDGEPAIRALIDTVARQAGKETQVQHAPKETHGPSNGAAERAILEVARQARTLVHALETRYPGYQLKGDSEVFPWVIRHSGWLITRFLIKADGRTPYERLKGREYKGEIVDPLETVHYKIDKDTRGKLDAQTSIGIWLGKTLSADEHVIGTPQGIRKCRSVWRRPEPRRWEKHRLEAVTGTPWQPKGQALVVPCDNKPLTLPDGRKVRSAYITLERQIKHGPTPGCPGCNCLAGEVKPHNAECKKRFNELYPREAAASREEPGEEGAQAVEGDSMDLTEAEASGADGPAQGSAAQGSGGTDPAQSRKDLKKQLADKAKERREAAQQQPQEEPKRFRQTQKGAKRTAEVPLEEAAAEAAQEEVIGGLPTLHDEPLLAAYPEDGLLDSQGAFDERTGEALPVEKVKKARGRELDKMIEHGVKEDITWEEAKRRGLKIVKSRWVDGWKPLPDDPQGVRSRCVAQEVNVSQRDDVASGTPPLKAHRMVISHAATKAPGARENKKLVARYDVSVAFFHADATGKIAVVPPKDLDQSLLWFLNKAMNGTREASKQWAAKILQNKKKWGFLEIESVPGLFYHPFHDLLVCCHGDDFLASGEKPSLEFLDRLMLEEYEVKILPKLGPPEHGGECAEGTHLHRKLTWNRDGYTWEADGKYARLLTKELHLEGGKGVDTPASKETGKNDRFAEEELPPEEASEFRRLAGTALYLSLDRPTIQFAVSDITAGMAKPRRIHMHRLKRLGRYLLKFPSEVWVYKYQEAPRELVLYTDSDWAQDPRTRKSMSGYVEMFGRHMIETSCARQATVALSSGEAEYYALTRGVAAGRMSQQIWQIVGYELPLIAKTDSTAGKGIAQRKDVGKLKHLELRELWLQSYVQDGKVQIRKEPTATNVADLGTKALNGPRIQELTRMLPLRRGFVAAILAACLRTAAAQPQEVEGSFDATSFWMYMVFVHLLALIGLVQLARLAAGLCRRRRAVTTRSSSTQTASSAQAAVKPAPASPGEREGLTYRRPAGGTAASSSKGRAGLETTPAAPSATSSGPKGRREELNDTRVEERRRAEELARRQLEAVFVTSKGSRYHKFTCGDLQRARKFHPQGVVQLTRQEAQDRGYTACGNCGG